MKITLTALALLAVSPLPLFAADIPELKIESLDSDLFLTTEFRRGEDLILRRLESKKSRTKTAQIFWGGKLIYSIIQNPLGVKGIDRQFSSEIPGIGIHEWSLSGRGIPDYIVVYKKRKEGAQDLKELFWISEDWEVVPVRSEKLFKSDGQIRSDSEVYLELKKDSRAFEN